MSEPYNFDFPPAPFGVCNRCGALVQDRPKHDEWHRQVLTGDALADLIQASRAAEEQQ